MVKDIILINGSSYVTFNDRSILEQESLYLLNKCVFTVCNKYDTKLVYKVKKSILNFFLKFTLNFLIRPTKDIKFNVSYLTNLSHFKNLLFDFKSVSENDYIHFLDLDSKEEEKIYYSKIHNVYLLSFKSKLSGSIFGFSLSLKSIYTIEPSAQAI